MDMCLPKFDIYQGTGVTNFVLEATQTLDVLIFFKETVLSDVRSEIHLVQRNIVSAGQSVRA